MEEIKGEKSEIPKMPASFLKRQRGNCFEGGGGLLIKSRGYLENISSKKSPDTSKKIYTMAFCPKKVRRPLKKIYHDIVPEEKSPDTSKTFCPEKVRTPLENVYNDILSEKNPDTLPGTPKDETLKTRKKWPTS